jgi:hypothetical protein
MKGNKVIRQEIGDKFGSQSDYVGTGYKRIVVGYYDRTVLYITTQHNWAVVLDFYSDNDVIGWRSRRSIWA